MKDVTESPLTCNNCHKFIKTDRARLQKNYYCSRSCYQEDRKSQPKKKRSDTGRKRAPRVIRECPVCGAEQELLESMAKFSKRTFCSREHADEYMRTDHIEPYWRKAKPGDTHSNGKGYLVEKTEDGWFLQHRVVMERHLGRKLLDSENVHHLNGVRDDNRIENLEIWVKSQPCGQRIEDVVAHAWSQIALYDPKHSQKFTGETSFDV